MARVKVLALNAGSSSLKASLFDLAAPGPLGAVPTGLCWEQERAAGTPLEALLAPLWTGPGARLTGPEEVDVVGHRVVHGGPTLTASVRVTPAVRAEIGRVADLAPAHNAAALALMDAATHLFGAETPQVAVFDTAFHHTMAPAVFTYAGPYAWVGQGIRRYGFHGLSHQYASHRAARLIGRPVEELRIVTCHLGSGCSLAAVARGRSVDTTMGFTPLDGLPMARRSGAIDPGLLLYLLRSGAHTPASLDHLLHHESGLAGLSGTSGDMRAVLAGVAAGDHRARLALDVFVHHVRQGMAAMATTMAGLDALVFTGGVGEHAPAVRAATCSGLAFLGVAVDPLRNEGAGEAEISAPGAHVSTWVVPAQENGMIARESLLFAASSPDSCAPRVSHAAGI